MKYTLYGLMIVGLLLGGCATKSYKMFNNSASLTQKTSDQNDSNDRTFEWKIAQGDRVEITVTNGSITEGEQQLNTILNTAGQGQLYQMRDGTEGILVAANGVVRLPLIDNVQIAGLTENQAAEKLTKKYEQYLKHPFVSVKILNQKLFVLGEVRKPGVVQVTHGTMSLFEALAFSGDLTDDADRTDVKIIRGGLNKPLVKEIDLADLSSMTQQSLNLQPNDIIYVQPRAMKAYNVAFKEQMPFFDMISSMLNPFVYYSQIKNAKAVDVFLFK